MDLEVVSWQGLVARAGTPAKARTLLTTGRWRRVLRDAYAPAWVEDGPALRTAALRAVLPEGVAVSHRAALWVYGLDVLNGTIDVTTLRGRHLATRPGISVHSAALPEEELCTVGGLLVVSAARAVVDVARSERLVEAVAVADAVLRSGAATQDQVLTVLESSGGLRGVVAARKVVPHLEPRSESPMESRFRMLLVLGGIPRPQAQWDVYTADGHVGRADFHLDGVVLEYDGRAARLDPGIFTAERRRQTGLAETQLELRRFTAADYYTRPAAAVCAEVVRALRLAAGRDRSGLRTGPDTQRKPRLRPVPTHAESRIRDQGSAA